MHSSYNVLAVDAVEKYPVRSELADPPTMIEALKKLKGGKAGGKSGKLWMAVQER